MKQAIIVDKEHMRLCLVTFLYFLITACGIGGSVEERVAAAQARNDGPPIWRVTDDDSTLYLYGTVHLLPADLDWQRDDMKAAFDEAGTIFFEFDTGDTAQLGMSVLTENLGLYKSGQSLTQQMDNYQLNLLEAAIHNGNINREFLISLKPWLAREFLSVAAGDEAGLSTDFAAEEVLKIRAQNLHKNIIYLDDLEQQLRESAAQSETVQMDRLTDALAEYSQLGENLRQIADAWVIGDIEKLEMAQSNSRGSDELLLLNRRNNWISDFESFMNRSGTALAAIEIANLLGDNSLQSLLRDRGYEVERFYAFQGENVIKTALE